MTQISTVTQVWMSGQADTIGSIPVVMQSQGGEEGSGFGCYNYSLFQALFLPIF